ncbi:DNA glycosylase [Lentinula aff. lateritia]|uniref:DNA glycosylase n=1 Tax=Lentinula aff. lateritia TaxID=2804960 RepID=A0ACC1U7W8_9AGAR|nr:DNA glycosylase [Lentinula aff. lateritia]
MTKRKRIEEETELSPSTKSTDQRVLQTDAHLPKLRKNGRKRGSLKGTRLGCETSTEASPDGPPVEDIDPIFPGHPKSSHIVSSPLPIRKALLKWYATVCTDRGMPWRKPHDVNLDMKEQAQRAYEVWVSEVMLQQTQVATVIPYFNAWMKKSVADLAESSVDEVNALWKGLGYYSRASRLLAAAQIVVRDYQGRLPSNAKEMEAHIPGIGRYSAGAISSIAYGERVPVLDGNVHRLFSRFLVLHAPPKSKATQDILWAAATAMVEHEYDDADHPGDINQALIELGSTICRHQSLPDIEDLCELCEPLTEENGVMAYPMKAKKKKARVELDVVSIVEWRSIDDRQFLLVRRPDKGLLAGLYEFPTTNMASASALMEMASDSVHQHLLDVLKDPVLPCKEKSLQNLEPKCYSSPEYCVVNVTPMGDVSHVFSHIKKTYRVQWVVIEGGTQPPLLKCGPGQPNLDHGSYNTAKNAFWASATNVTKANISTGVNKIWKYALTIWETQEVYS